MALTKIGTDGVKDDAITSGKIPANAVGSSEIADTSVTLAKLEHGTSSNNGKFLRANNGADPTFETVSTDLVGDTSPQLGGDLASNGNDIVMADNDEIKLGASNDFTMFHDSSGHTFLQDQGNGALRIRSDSEVAIQKWDGSTNENMAKFVPDGAVELYHNNDKRIETESNGATLTGARLKVQNSGNTDFNLRDTSTNAVSAYIGAKTAGRVEYNCYKEGVGTKYPHVFVGYTEEYARIDTNGIKFNGDTAAANALDDYEEGTWTPRVQGLAISDGSNPTNAGRYVKIGRLIQVIFYINVGTISYETGYSSSSQLVFTGLPFANGHGGDGYAGLDIGNLRYLDGGNSTQSTNRMICFNIGSTQSQYTGRWVQLGNNNFVNATLGDLYNNFSIHASGVYQTA